MGHTLPVPMLADWQSSQLSMNLIELEIDSLRLGSPLPFALRSVTGVLLARKGYVIGSRDELDVLIQRGQKLCVDVDEHQEHHRAYVGKLYNMVAQDTNLGDLDAVKMSTTDFQHRVAERPRFPDWIDVQERTNNALRGADGIEAVGRFEALYLDLAYYTEAQPDETLLSLLYLSGTETRLYSATHALIVSVLCQLAASDILRWSDQERSAVGLAALTMNISMTSLQDMLSTQTNPLSGEQMRLIEQHPARSAAMLKDMGVMDPLWLETVALHHSRTTGPLADKTPAQRLARLIQRADSFTARLSPRATRAPMGSTQAMQASYFDELKQVDEAGAALIKAVGVYPPGSFVRLVTNEVAIVLKRGTNTTTPKVACVLNRQGMPMLEPIVRDTGFPNYKITAPVARRDVKLQLQLHKFVQMVA
jgi:HD-GYP domain-containing protein (c-di-GMP phosphodiesterase class II)